MFSSLFNIEKNISLENGGIISRWDHIIKYIDEKIIIKNYDTFSSRIGYIYGRKNISDELVLFLIDKKEIKLFRIIDCIDNKNIKILRIIYERVIIDINERLDKSLPEYKKIYLELFYHSVNNKTNSYTFKQLYYHIKNMYISLSEYFDASLPDYR